MPGGHSITILGLYFNLVLKRIFITILHTTTHSLYVVSKSKHRERFVPSNSHYEETLDSRRNEKLTFHALP